MKNPNILAFAAAAVIAIFCNATVRAESAAFGDTKETTASKSKKKPKKPTVKAVNNANCPVAGAPIGSMGEGTSVTHKAYKVSLCCSGCTAKFNSNPDAYLQTAQSDTKRK